MAQRSRVLIAVVLLAVMFAVAPQSARPGEPTGQEIADLIDDLRDSDSHVREVAHRELVRLRGASVAALVAAARGSDLKLSDEALSVLADIGTDAKAAAPKLVELASTVDSVRFIEIARVVARIDPSAAGPLVGPLVELASSSGANLDRQQDALAILASLGGVAREASPALLARLATAEPSTRDALVATLTAIGTDPTVHLLDLWTAGSEPVAEWLPAALVAIGKPAVDAASQRLRSADKNTRVAAAAVLGAMGAPAREAVPALVFALKDEAAAVRRTAARSLGLIGADAQIALPALTVGVSDAQLRYQRDAIVAIGQIGVAASRPGDTSDKDVAPVASGRTGGGGATKQTESAVMWALRWLKHHQSPDGHWDCGGFSAQCKLNRCDGPGEATYDPGVSGLALLCFLGAGETHQSGTCKETVTKGLNYLRGIQDSDGCFGPRSSQHFLYNHACAALAITEAYGMTSSRVFKEPAQRGVAFVLKAKNPYLAWRYNYPPDGDNDTSITGWMVMVLKSASMSGLSVDKSALEDAVKWVDKMTEPKFGRTGYQQRGGPAARTNEMMTKFPNDKSEALTAVGVLTRIFAGHTPSDDPLIMKGADLIVRKLPEWDVDGGTIDFYYWHYGSLAMFQVGGEHWEKWNEALKAALIPKQRMEAERDERGSWDPMDCWSPEGGRIYATAMNCLSMEACYRYGRLLGAKNDAKKQAVDQQPVMSPSLRDAVGALTDALKSDDAEVSRAAESVLDQLRAAYRASPTDPAPAPEAPPSVQPRVLVKKVANCFEYAKWIKRFVDARLAGSPAAIEVAWAEGTTPTWLFPATIESIRDGRVWARIDSDRAFIFRSAVVVDLDSGRQRVLHRWGFGPESHEFEVLERPLLDALRVGMSVEVTIDLDPTGVTKAMDGDFPAQLTIWRITKK